MTFDLCDKVNEMSDFGNKISELNPLASGNMGGEVPLSLTLSSGTLATNKITLSQLRDLFDFSNAYSTVAEGIAATVENQMFYVYVDSSKLSVNEYIRTNIGANAVIGNSGTKKIIYIPELLKHVKVQVNSFAALREFKPWWEGQVVYLKGYYEESTTGGGDFVGYLGTMEDDGGVNASGSGFYWERIFEGGISPEMFGAIGDGITDDFLAIQNMLDYGPLGCTFNFSSDKIYYNAFANDGLWKDLKKRNMWQRNKGATFNFNNCKIRRRLAKWNDLNAKNNTNSGQYYTDDGTALLYLSGEGYVIRDADFDGGTPLGNILNYSGNPTDNADYAVGTCMDHGLYLDAVKDISIIDSKFSKVCFPIYCNACNNITGINLTVQYAAQASSRVTSTDIALGGGIKLISCNNVQLSNIKGLRNVNTTVEIEPYNKNVYVQGQSDFDYSNSLVILYSSYIQFDWIGRNIVNGNGITIRGGASSNLLHTIQGKAIIDTCSWIGCQIYVSATALSGISAIKIDLITRNTGKYGLNITNTGSNYGIDVDINHNHYSDTIASETANYISGTVFGNLSGSVHNSPIGIRVTGVNTPLKCLRVCMDLRDNVTTPISVGETAYVEILNTSTQTSLSTSTPLQHMYLKNTTLANNVNDTNGWIHTQGRYTSIESKTFRIPTISTVNDNSSYGFYLTGTAPNYTVTCYKTEPGS